jgi:Bcr/CflA subfamily drug resistance transporter
MKHISMPAIWLIVLIAGIGQLSETVYSPALPAIATSLGVTASWVEYTLTIYLFSFGIGTLFWGRLSDHFGRKPCILAGLAIYILGSFGCYMADSLTILMISRFVQGFGGSIGSVLAQAIVRDAFQGPALGKAYASITGSLALFPAIGPIVGGIITQQYSWSMIFAFLIVFGVLIFLVSAQKLPETLIPHTEKLPSVFAILYQLAKDKKVIGYGLLVAICNGITFSYYAEGSFYLIELLGLSPSQYGTTFILMAFATIIGSIISRKMHSKITPLTIIWYGLLLIVFGNSVLCIGALFQSTLSISKTQLLYLTIGVMMGNMAGVCMVTSNSLAQALQNYRYAIGTASSLFGFSYYLGVSLCTFGMGMLHNGTAIPMPLYFFGLGILMVLIFHTSLKKA